MLIRKILIAFLLILSTDQLRATQNSIGLDINSQDVEILGSINIERLNYYTDGTTYLVDLSYLGTENDSLLTIGISAQNMLQGQEDLSLAFGFKSVLSENFLSFPLFAKASYMLPLKHQIPPTSLSASFAYAPSVLSFRDAKNYSEFRLEADMEVITNIHIFTGFRRINTNYESNDKIFNNSLYGGLKLSF